MSLGKPLNNSGICSSAGGLLPHLWESDSTTVEYISQFEMLVGLYASGYQADTTFPAAVGLCASPTRIRNEEGLLRSQAIQTGGTGDPSAPARLPLRLIALAAARNKVGNLRDVARRFLVGNNRAKVVPLR